MFTDEIRVFVKGGDGGDGCQSFAKTTTAAFRGPDGGDGGSGGHLWLIVDQKLNSLNFYRHNRHHRGNDGVPGQRRKDGKDARDSFLKVPVGTCVYSENGDLLADLNHPGQKFLIAHGGRGGRGNRSLISKTLKVPRYAEKGEPGEEFWVKLELKLTADIGIIGFPNAGKSTLISRLSNARPKIADYPFTTIEPNLGMVEVSREESMLMLDIPGIIEGAHEGTGLGHKFLRHVERCGFLVHLIDVSPYSGREPFEAYSVLNRELIAYSQRLSGKLQVVVLNKVDMPGTEELREEFLKSLKASGYEGEVLQISALTGEGLELLKHKLWEALQTHPPEIEIFEDQIVERKVRLNQVEKFEEGHYRISGDEIERICRQTDFRSEEAVARLQALFYKRGFVDQLRDLGVKQGDTIELAGVELEYEQDGWEDEVDSEEE